MIAKSDSIAIRIQDDELLGSVALGPELGGLGDLGFELPGALPGSVEVIDYEVEASARLKYQRYSTNGANTGRGGFSKTTNCDIRWLLPSRFSIDSTSG